MATRLLAGASKNNKSLPAQIRPQGICALQVGQFMICLVGYAELHHYSVFGGKRSAERQGF